MSLDKNFADRYFFACEHCHREYSCRGLRWAAGKCGSCKHNEWVLHTEYIEGGEVNISVTTVLLAVLFGIHATRNAQEVVKLITHGVSEEEALTIAKASYSVGSKMAYEYMILRRDMEHEVDRQRLVDRGGKNCRECGILFMPIASKPWTGLGFCSKACAAALHPEHEVEASATPVSVPKVPQTIAVRCECGHLFDVPALYLGTKRPCPRCQAKAKVH